MRAGAGRPVLCHNDFYGPNLLVHGDDICLIDWEYAAMGDYGCDFGNFVAQGSGYDVDRALAVLPLYFGRTPTAEERLHCIACVAVVGWYWYVWALFKECKGSPVGEWTRIWYDAAKRFGAAAQAMIDEGIISAEEVKLLQPKKQIAGVVISVIVVAALAYTCVKMLPYGPICALFGLAAGIMKYRKVLQFNSLTVQRFKTTYKDSYDAKKLNAYVDKMF